MTSSSVSMSESVTWRTVIPALLAPVLLIGGWTCAAAVRPENFDQISETISALAAREAPHRWLMTTVFVLVGVCYLLTAWGLNAAAPGGRLIFAIGGLATCVVAAVPLPPSGPSMAHSSIASVAFLALAVWPTFAWRPGDAIPWVLRKAPSLVAAAVLVGLLVWFGAALNLAESIGLAERVAAGAQAVWPLIVVLVVRREASGKTGAT